MKKIILYTDGACSGNPGKGGWGVLLRYNGVEKEFSGAEKETTNNKMELTAVIEGFKRLKEPCEVEVYSDSAYVVNAFEKEWIYKWTMNNWMTASKKDVKNVDLWKQLFEFTKVHKVKFIKVKGHSDNEYNNRCDKLATAAILTIK